MTVRTAVRLYSDKKVEMPAVDFKAQPEMATERNNLRKNTQEAEDANAVVPEIKIYKNLDAATAEPSARVAKLVEEILSLNIFEAAQLSTFYPVKYLIFCHEILGTRDCLSNETWPETGPVVLTV